ncbi:MAG: PAS domain S-box protein [Candidatus Nitrohelix vancouverensis]|uniref:PAS domain S-box protein n=1 Tax=Candidatus Nitrohelix vancouverensis TaxID=2705534 RepID=A0A7T0C471_9BACT|nr:MAG: PAS domain S-box protein [Candidatus Nitrohelix vancouverensis]
MAILSSYIFPLSVVFCVFFVDLFVELGVASGALYILALVTYYGTRDLKLLVRLSILCTLLILLGYILSPPGGEFWKIVLNRCLSISILWVFTFSQLWLDKTSKVELYEELVDRIHWTQNELSPDSTHDIIYNRLLEDLLSLSKSRFAIFLQVKPDENGELSPFFRASKFSGQSQEAAPRKELLRFQDEMIPTKDLSEGLLKTITQRKARSMYAVDGVVVSKSIDPLLPSFSSCLLLPINSGNVMDGVACVFNTNEDYPLSMSFILDPYLKSFSLALQSFQLRNDTGKAISSPKVNSIDFKSDSDSKKFDSIYSRMEEGVLTSSRKLIEMRDQLGSEIKKHQSSVDQQNRLMSILEFTSDFVGIAGIAGEVKYVNPAGRLMVGLGPDGDLSHLSISDFHETKAADYIFHYALPVAIKNGVWEGESSLIHKDGRIIPVSQVIVAHKSSTGAVDFFSTVARDITKQKTVEETLRLQNETKKSLINSLPAHISVIDTEGNIVLVNEAWVRFALENGLSNGNIFGSGTNYLEVCFNSGDEGGQAGRGILDVIKGISQTFKMEYSCHSEVEKRWFLLYVTPLVGEKQGAVVAHYPITDRVEAKTELEKSKGIIHGLYNRLKSEVEEEKLRMAHEIHDELGPCLTSLNMDIGWLQNQISNSQESIQNELDKMARKVSTTLLLVRKISTDLRPEILDLYGLSEAIKWKLDNIDDRLNLEYEFFSNHDFRDFSRDIALTLFRVFQEALTNTIRHSQATKIKVLLVRNKYGTLLRIIDNGSGIAHIENGPSLGVLGMQERVESVGGKFKIDGATGQGTVVEVQLPLMNGGNENGVDY